MTKIFKVRGLLRAVLHPEKFLFIEHRTTVLLQLTEPVFFPCCVLLGVSAQRCFFKDPALATSIAVFLAVCVEWIPVDRIPVPTTLCLQQFL